MIGSRPRTVVHLSDGFGNQLFQWAAGQFLEGIGHSVLYDVSMAGRGFTSHGHSIAERGLPGRFRERTGHGNRSRWRRESRRFARRLRLAQLGKLIIREEYRSDVLGWDSGLELIQPGTRVFGYFQSYRYLLPLKDTRLNPNTLLPRQESSTGARDLLDFGRQERPVVIHIRRGDYWRVTHTLGVLTGHYFRRALKMVREAGIKAPAVLISDSEHEMRDILGYFEEPVKLLKTPPEIDPGELLAFMSHGSSHILSNSSLSWWGAVLASKPEAVIAPEPWFKNPAEGQPRHLLLPNWLRCPAEFESDSGVARGVEA